MGVEALSPHMLRITLGGEELAGLVVDEPAASIRLLVPAPGQELVIPTWNGNEFLLEGGARPIIRTFTPLNLDMAALTIDVDVVKHPGGAISSWAAAAGAGAAAAISGPGRGYTVDREAPAYLLAGDETALPAIGQLIEAIPAATALHAIVELAHPAAQLDLPAHPRLTTEWVIRSDAGIPGSGLVPAIQRVALVEEAKVWVAGEAAAMHRVRRHLFDDRGLARVDATVRGYWKHGR
jgi:NADPH-dependent ferric siderophore reductase